MAIQTARATFTGAEPYVDVPIVPPMNTPSVAAQGIALDDSTAVIDYSITLTGGTSARVEPSNAFVGRVDFVLIDT